MALNSNQPLDITDLTLSKGENGQSSDSRYSAEELANTRTLENYLGFTAIFDGVQEKVSVDFNQMDLADGNISGYKEDAITQIMDNNIITPESAIFSFDVKGGDNHPDHIATNDIATQVASLYGASLLEFGLPDNTRRTVQLSSEQSTISRSFVSNHTSQFGQGGTNLHSPHDSLLSFNAVSLHI